MKDLDVKIPAVKIGDRFGRLVVSSPTYYVTLDKKDKMRKQYVDCVCDCGKTREKIKCGNLKRENVLGYCGRDCPLYKVVVREVPESHKLCKLGDKFNKLTVIKEAYYEQQKGEPNRSRCVGVQCECGNVKSYRESKVFAGKYKSCGCTWEYSGTHRKNRNEHLRKKYGLSQEDYETMLRSQDGKCAICGYSTDPTSNKHKSLYLCVDHCHATGKIRGLLCEHCNRGLGGFRDNPDFLASAISYLKDNSQIQT